MDIGRWRIPGMQPQNWNIGGRFHTLIGSTEITALYYLDSAYGLTLGNPASLRWTSFTNLWTYEYPQVNEVGLTADRPLPMPSSLGEYLPLVGRAEFLYVNHQSFPDMRPTSLTAQRYSDVVKWMAALDLDQAYAPWMSSTGNLTANLEVTDAITMDNAKTMPFNGNDVSEANNKNEVNALLKYRHFVVVGRLRADLDHDLGAEGQYLLIVSIVRAQSALDQEVFCEAAGD